MAGNRAVQHGATIPAPKMRQLRITSNLSRAALGSRNGLCLRGLPEIARQRAPIHAENLASAIFAQQLTNETETHEN